MLAGIGIWFVIFFAVELIALFCLVSFERPFAAGLVFAGSLWLSDVIFETAFIPLIWTQPLTVIGIFAGYLLIGLAWSFGRWWIYATKIRDEYLDAMARFRTSHNLPADCVLNKEQMSKFRSHYRHIACKIPLYATENKIKIFSWIVYWPISIVLTTFDDLLYRIFRNVFELIQGFYQSISDRVFAGINSPFSEDD